VALTKSSRRSVCANSGDGKCLFFLFVGCKLSLKII
jgi:hypothetical protein